MSSTPLPNKAFPKLKAAFAKAALIPDDPEILHMTEAEVFDRLKMHLNEAFAPGCCTENRLRELHYAQRYLYELELYAADAQLQKDYQKEQEEEG